MKIENVKRELEELKGVMLDYHRAAANLDTCIQNIEQGLKEDLPDSQYLYMMILRMHAYRGDYLRLNNFTERENVAWKKLYDSTKEEEA